MTKKIKLSQGEFAIVDDEDYDFLNQWKWTCHSSKNKKYAFRYPVTEDGKRVIVFMHNLVNPVESGYENDHINGNGLDNRKENLRKCTRAENNRNAGKRKDNTSGFKGVTWNPKKSRWIARITIGKKRFYLGMHKTKEDAAKAYDNAAQKYYGNFSKINFE